MEGDLTNSENLILEKVLEGDFSPFKYLSKQLNKLRVKDRRKKYHTYLVQFSHDNMDSLRLSGHEESIKIYGTKVFIEESGAKLHVNVKVIDGFISSLLIGGKYDFVNDFTIKEVVWENRNDDPQKEGTIIYNANERDFKKAISYIPMYT